ncbi:kinase-like protein [Schizopora paradoxa]|uniref:Kinase-like protein n=1 Tax=Schizopora paradoxa TaxID=27342 RepID=A0A0H2R8G8_9AGAM|nr:kinase-like protein [Schizopora paradoxa]
MVPNEPNDELYQLNLEIYKLKYLDLVGHLIIDKRAPKLGGQSDVFSAWSTKHGKRVALKRVRIYMKNDLSFAKKLVREMRIWARLDHDCILPLLGFIIEGEDMLPSLISEWMEHGTLNIYMSKLPRGGIETWNMVGWITSGLDYLHCKGIIHADLKCENILISSSGKPLLADFGLSVALSHSTTVSTAHGSKGTTRWLAVELLNPDSSSTSPNHTEMSDIWAFGMVIYELLSGQIPYHDIKNEGAVILAIATGKLPARPYIDNDGARCDETLWLLCHACWKRFHDTRPSTKDIISLWYRSDMLPKEHTRVRGDRPPASYSVDPPPPFPRVAPGAPAREALPPRLFPVVSPSQSPSAEAIPMCPSDQPVPPSNWIPQSTSPPSSYSEQSTPSPPSFPAPSPKYPTHAPIVHSRSSTEVVAPSAWVATQAMTSSTFLPQPINRSSSYPVYTGLPRTSIPEPTLPAWDSPQVAPPRPPFQDTASDPFSTDHLSASFERLKMDFPPTNVSAPSTYIDPPRPPRVHNGSASGSSGVTQSQSTSSSSRGHSSSRSKGTRNQYTDNYPSQEPETFHVQDSNNEAFGERQFSGPISKHDSANLKSAYHRNTNGSSTRIQTSEMPRVRDANQEIHGEGRYVKKDFKASTTSALHQQSGNKFSQEHEPSFIQVDVYDDQSYSDHHKSATPTHHRYSGNSSTSQGREIPFESKGVTAAQRYSQR